MMAAKMGEVKEMVETELRTKMEEMREEMREEMEEKNKELDAMREEMSELTAKLREENQKSVRDLPYLLTCAYKENWYTAGATITYDRLSVDFNNSGGGDGEMNISTGKFTAVTAGHFTITYSGIAWVNPGQEYLWFELMKNDESAGAEGKWESYSASSNGGQIHDQGSRTVLPGPLYSPCTYRSSIWGRETPSTYRPTETTSWASSSTSTSASPSPPSKLLMERRGTVTLPSYA